MMIYKFELKKLLIDKKNILLLFALLLLIPVFFFQVEKEETAFFEEKSEFIVSNHKSFSEQSDQLTITNLKMNAPTLARQILLINHILDALEEWFSVRMDAESVLSTKKELTYYQKLNDYQKEFDEIMPQQALENKLSVFKQLTQNNLSEIPNEVGSNGWYFFKAILDLWQFQIGLPFMVLIFFAYWSNDFEKKHYRLIITQPIALRSYLNKKFVLACSFIFLSLSLMLIIAFFMGALTNESGSLLYPILTDSNQILPLYQYVAICLLVNSVSILFALAVVELLSLYVKDNAISLIYNSILLVLLNILVVKVFNPKNYYFLILFDGQSLIKNYFPFSLYDVLFWCFLSLIVTFFIRKQSHKKLEV